MSGAGLSLSGHRRRAGLQALPEVSALLDLSRWTDTGTLRIPDIRSTTGNAATQSVGARKPAMSLAANGRGIATFSAAAPSSLLFPSAANNNSTQKWGLAFWMRAVSYPAFRYVLDVGGGAGTYDNVKAELFFNSNRSCGFSLFGQDTNNYNGRRGTTALSVLPVAGTWASLRLQFDGTQATEALRHKLYVNGTDIALTYTNEGAGGTPLLLRPNAANVPWVIGNYNDSADATYAADVAIGGFIWVFSGTPDPVAAHQMLEAARPT